MTNKNSSPDEVISYKNCSFALKKKIVRLVENGRISKNHAAKKYGVSRSSIDYWCKKMSTLDYKNQNMDKDTSPQKENKKLRERIEELEFIKDYQQDIIVEFTKLTGKEVAKKLLPKQLSDEIEKKLRMVR